ncbi:DUF3718 domain-containing protein [Bowmanella dokdonensis]|uniref:DUF3718 domain-containing protein n=1 Tax=Bowmanella dokdonensis TaxID=751969 RepID=A0A939DMV0_9ALTE|nr:DUF3718 domain-containing protein [Bowmanella dokdonensis]MBN7825398.1 DUF3718 domain-containing protein [Bowmanella dokdonensis]
MFRIKTIAIAGLLCLPLTALAKTTYVAADDSKATQLCLSVAMDSQVSFLIKQKGSGYKMRYLANNLHCNDQLVGDFAQQTGNNRVARLLQRLEIQKGHTEIKDVASQSQGKQEQDLVVMVRGR